MTESGTVENNRGFFFFFLVKIVNTEHIIILSPYRWYTFHVLHLSLPDTRNVYLFILASLFQVLSHLLRAICPQLTFLIFYHRGSKFDLLQLNQKELFTHLVNKSKISRAFQKHPPHSYVCLFLSPPPLQKATLQWKLQHNLHCTTMVFFIIWDEKLQNYYTNYSQTDYWSSLLRIVPTPLETLKFVKFTLINCFSDLSATAFHVK